MTGDVILLRVLQSPRAMETLGSGEWDELIRQARMSRLLPRLEYLAKDAGIWLEVPEKARDIIRGAQAWVDHYQLIVRYELSRVQKVLSATKFPLLLLKGAAYIEANLPPGRGRSLSDLDLLLRWEHLNQAENLLKEHGWGSRLEDDYDQRYYREWMHEIPPLVHPLRGVEVDLHHNLLPLTGRYQVPAEKLWESAVPLEKGLLVLSPADMVLHSAVHLVVADELRGGLRDLFDIHQLCLHFMAEDPGFPEQLICRARELGLAKPLWYVLEAARALLNTPVETASLAGARGELPAWPVRKLMNHLVREVLRPRRLHERPPAFRQWLLYLRSHWIRMPPALLASHLARKSMVRLRGGGKGR